MKKFIGRWLRRHAWEFLTENSSGWKLVPENYWHGYGSHQQLHPLSLGKFTHFLLGKRCLFSQVPLLIRCSISFGRRDDKIDKIPSFISSFAGVASLKNDGRNVVTASLLGIWKMNAPKFAFLVLWFNWELRKEQNQEF
jgi:hypothetical protein